MPLIHLTYEDIELIRSLTIDKQLTLATTLSQAYENKEFEKERKDFISKRMSQITKISNALNVIP